MKIILTIIILLAAKFNFAQSPMPTFLQGTWKVENEGIYEHWDKLNENLLKGFSYTMVEGQMHISEYLEIVQSQNNTTYTANVVHQNNGESVTFTLTKTDSTFIFENPKHDFPKKIVYQLLNDTALFVQVSDGKQKGFSYKMIKQVVTAVTPDTVTENPNYDPILAQKLGGDDYGMKAYVLVILKTGVNTATDKEIINKSFSGHMDNINLLVKEGKLIVAGPLGKNEQTYRGIFILNVTTFDEAKTLLQNDTAITDGFLAYDLFQWYGSAALPEYLIASDKIWKIKP